MKKIFYSFLLSILCTSAAWAVPAQNKTIKHIQPDGTELTLRLVGDEYMHYYLNLTDGTKMRQGEDGHYYTIAASAVQEMLQSATTRRQEAQQRRSVRMEQTRRMSRNDRPKRIGSMGNMTGNKKGIVILVNFKDKAMNSSHTQTTFDAMFNQSGYNADGHIGSVADYFKAQSYGNFNLTFDVVGPVTLSNNMAYYGGNNTSGSDKNPGAMVKQACNAVNSQVNFADYDWDGDGFVDQVFVIYAGYGENYQGADENTIWPHEWDLSSAGVGVLTLDGVTIKTYACCAELYGTSGSTLNGMGTACHEFSHCLGYPDSYDTDYSGGIGMDSYDVMCGGSYNGPNGRGEVPVGYTAYERWMAGWLTPTELNSATDVTDMADLGSAPTAYVIYNSSNKNEYFLLENRQSKDWFKYYDYNTAGHGLFITHIDYSKTAWTNNTPNDDASHQRLTWVPADKKYGTYNSSSETWSVTSSEQKGDFFPGTSRVTSFTPSSWGSVGGKWFTSENGSYYSTHYLSNITENTTAGTISFKVDGGDDGARYTITYHAGAGSCTTSSWTQTSSSSEPTTLPSATIASDEWKFVGWSTTSVTQTRTKPSTLYLGGATFTPSRDMDLYAVYSKNESNSESGTYTLDWADDGVSAKTLGYGTAGTYTAADGGTWVIKAYKNNGMQLNGGKNASIKVPECPQDINSIEITAGTARVFKFSDTDYTGSNTPTVAASSTSSAEATIDLSSKSLSTGYIYTTDGASTIITKIVVNYGAGGGIYYATSPDLANYPTPTISFAEANSSGKAMLVGDTYTNTATASCTGVTLPAVTYRSSKTDVATVDASGKVTAVGVGTTTITASVAAVSGKSRSASTSYTVNVTMPSLSSIAVKTQPDKTTYWDDEEFETAGMEVTATYANGYTKIITTYTCIKKDNLVTISYTEGGVTKTATVVITVNSRPRYTVTFSAPENKCATPSLSETAYQGGVTLPTCSNFSEDWIFAGWATTSVASATTTKPTLLMAGSTYKPSADCTLYAVFKMTEGEGEKWKKVTDLSSVSEGTYAIISNDGHAFNGTITSGKGQQTTGVFTFTNNEASSAPEGTCKISLIAVSGGYKMYNKDKGSLYAKDNASGNLDWHSTENSFWKKSGSEWIYGNNSAKLRYYNSAFNTYGNTANGNIIQFAQLVSSSTITYHSNPVPAVVCNVTLNVNGGTINAGNVSTYQQGKGATLPTDVTRTGYTFGGWYDNADLTGEAVTVIGTDATGAKEYWAKWTENVKVSSITLNATSKTVTYGDADFTLTATIAPADAFDKSISWSSSNTSVATVSNGTVHIVGAGSANITVKSSSDETKTATCALTVNKANAVITPNTPNGTWDVTLKIGATLTPAFTTTPADAQVSLAITEGSDKISLANGIITGVAAGSAKVTATYAGNNNYNSLVKTFNITVPAKLTLTYSVNGNTTVKAAGHYYEGEPIDLTAPTSGIPEGYVFKGWSFSPVATQQTAPTYVGTTMPAESQTYYAVFAVESGSGPSTILSEEFDNNTTEDATTAFDTSKFSNFSGTTSKAFTSKDGGVKFGSSSAAGFITSKSLDLSKPFTVQLDIKKFGSDTGSIDVTVGETKKSKTPSSSDKYETVVFSFDAATSSSTIKIGTSSKRGYIDNVIVTSSGGTSYSDYCTSVGAKILTGIEFGGTLTKRNYTEGEQFDPAGITVLASYEGQAEKGDVTSKATLTYSKDPLTTSTHLLNVSATYKGQTVSKDYVITVSELPKYTVTFYNYGETTYLKESAYQSGVTPPAVDAIDGYTFVGWSSTNVQDKTKTKPTIVSLTDGKYMPTASIWLYAVYSRIEESNSDGPSYTIKTNVSGFPTAYGTPNTISISGITYNLYNVGHFSKNNLVQFKRDAGYISNQTQMPTAIRRIVINGANATEGFALVVGSTEAPATAISASVQDNTYTFDCSGKNATYFKLSGGSSTMTASSIVITCAAPPETYYTSCPVIERSLPMVAYSEGYYYATFSNERPTFFPSSGEDYEVKLYSVNVSTNSNLALTELNRFQDGNNEGYYVPWNAGVLICAHFTGDSRNITYYVEECLPCDFDSFKEGVVNLLHGAATDKSAFADHYFYKLAYNNYTEKTGLGFYWGADNGGAFTTKAGGAYLAIKKQQANMIRSFTLNNATDDPEIIIEDDTPLIIHTLAGQRIQKIQKSGLYIVNGKTKWMQVE